MIGSIAMAITLTAALASVMLYALVARGRGELLTAARTATHTAILGVFTSAGVLLYYIFNHHFEINYVYEHTALSLSKPLLFSTFYASQEGSFMLWAVWTSLIAIFLMTYAARQRYEAHVMAVFMSILAFLAVMLIAKSPFQTIYSAHPGEAPAGFIPTDGKGLNPTLQNLWIVIHPPMLFLGFSLLAVPFSFAIAGLFKRDYQGWISTSMPWTLGAAMVLGFGIMLGGFWAYETLGWGGYWGWDPVENASLLPWLITLAAVHTMLTQRRTGGLVRTNIAMTLLAYALVLYASYLTRSGILGDASVHSFADPGNLVTALLEAALIVFIGVPIVLFFTRWRHMRTVGQEYKLLSRETALAIGAAVLGASALVVFIGTSAPLVSKKVDNDFYNDLHIPIAIVLMLINGLSLLLKWKQSNTSEMLKRAGFSLIATLVATIAAFALGLRDPKFLGMLAAAFFALFVNLEIGWQVFKGKWAVDFSREPVSKFDYWKRIRTGAWLTLGVGILALLIGTAGDYNLFADAIVQYGPYVLILLAIVIAMFVTLGYPKFTFDTKFLGAYVAHMGVAIFLIGVIVTARYSKHEMEHMYMNVPVKAFGGDYTLIWKGVTTPEIDHSNFVIDVSDRKGHIGTAAPLMYLSDFNKRQSPFINPSILKYAAKDLYFTCYGVDMSGGVPKDTLGKMQSIKAFEGKEEIKFVDFDFPDEEKQKMRAQQDFRVKATVQVKSLASDTAKPQTLTLSVVRNLSSEDVKEDDVKIPGTSYHVQLAQLMPNMTEPAKSRVVLRYFDEKNPPPAEKEFITVEAFVKPYINFVWAGILILVVGFGFSMFRRRREAIVAIERAEQQYARVMHHASPLEEARGPVASEKASAMKLTKKQRG
jgi:c-type cytochrome biogenesis protein CcmF